MNEELEKESSRVWLLMPLSLAVDLRRRDTDARGSSWFETHSSTFEVGANLSADEFFPFADFFGVVL
jgi:hypothetical protein